VGDVQLQVGQLREPDQRGGVVADEVFDIGIVVCGKRGEALDERWRALFGRLLIETRALDAVGKAGHRDGTIAEVGKDDRGDLKEVADEITLGEGAAVLESGPEHLVEGGQAEVVAIEVDSQYVFDGVFEDIERLLDLVCWG